MRYLGALTFLLICSLTSVAAQDKSEDTITRIKAGNYKFAKGEVQVSFVDTVSPGYAKQQVEDAGFEILSMAVLPYTFFFKQKLTPKRISEIQTHPFVESITVKKTSYDSAAVKRMAIRENMSKEEEDKAHKRFKKMAEVPRIYIYLKHNIVGDMIQRFIDEHPDLNLRYSSPVPKTMVVKTPVGKEANAMRVLKKIPIVTGTAYVTLIDY